MMTMKIRNNSKLKGFSTVRSNKLFAVITIFLLATVGSYLVIHSSAYQINMPEPCREWGNTVQECSTYFNNPTLTNSCVTGQGLDIALLVDTSASMTGRPLAQAKVAVETLITELSGTNTYFAAGRMDRFINPFHADGYEAFIDLARDAQIGDHGVSGIGDLQYILDQDPRPNSPNLFIILTDGNIGYTLSQIRAVQQAGTRILTIGFGDVDIETLKLIAGTNVNTGSFWTSDVITSSDLKFTGKGPDSLESIMRKIANECKGPGPGRGEGDGKTGQGTDGQGPGQGPSTGAGGGGGAAANKQQEKPNPVPNAAAQGDVAEQPKPEPSPFFDGRNYEKGSDSDNLVFGNSTIGGKKVPKILLYLLSALLLGGAGGALYWRWKRQR